MASNYSDKEYTTSGRFTEKLVDELKYQLRRNSRRDRLVDTGLIEKLTFEYRQQNCPGQFEIEQWKRHLRGKVNPCSDETLKRCMAYCDDVNEVPEILNEISKSNEESNSSNEYAMEKSFDQIVDCLKDIYDKSRKPTVKDLFQTILETDDKNIDRADRLLFSYACQSYRRPNDYTMAQAHDQVQAIRLMRFKSDRAEDLDSLIRDHRRFDDAYSYLQSLTKAQIASQSPDPSSNPCYRYQDSGRNSTPSDKSNIQNDAQGSLYNSEHSSTKRIPSLDRNSNSQSVRSPSPRPPTTTPPGYSRLGSGYRHNTDGQKSDVLEKDFLNKVKTKSPHN